MASVVSEFIKQQRIHGINNLNTNFMIEPASKRPIIMRTCADEVRDARQSTTMVPRCKSIQAKCTFVANRAHSARIIITNKYALRVTHKVHTLR